MKNSMEYKAKPSISKAILSVLLFVVLYVISYIIICIIGAFIFYLLDKIPVINSIMRILFRIRKDSPDILVPLISLLVSYFINAGIISHINKNIATIRLVYRIVGALFCISHIVFLIINVSLNHAFLINIFHIILGIYMFAHASNIDSR